MLGLGHIAAMSILGIYTWTFQPPPHRLSIPGIHIGTLDFTNHLPRCMSILGIITESLDFTNNPSHPCTSIAGIHLGTLDFTNHHPVDRDRDSFEEVIDFRHF